MHATALYKREPLVAMGGFDVTLRGCEDYDVYLRLTRAGRIAAHPNVVAEYRWHGGNMSADATRMLRAVLLVHDRHRVQRGERRRAWRAGRRNWKRWYRGTQQRMWGRTNDGVTARTMRGARAALARTARATPLGDRAIRFVRRTLGRQTWPPPLRGIDFGDLARTVPVSPDFGWDRGRPIDRFYVESFLARHARDVRGSVLEIGDDAYSRAYGGSQVVTQHVLHVDASHPGATLHGDLAVEGVLPRDAFDCIVLTQTLHLIFELETAVRRLHDALAPGGVLLLTVPGISQVDRHAWRDRWYWSFTVASLRRLFETAFEPDALAVESHGNVFAAIAFLTGAVVEDVDASRLDARDDAYPVVVTMRAVRR
jgi:hypothetical protein